MLDRFDMRVEMTRVAPGQLLSGPPSESSAVVEARIAAARARAFERSGGRVNSLLSGSAALAACRLARADRAALTELAREAGLTARGVHRVLRVARTVADLAGRAAVAPDDLYAAARLREPTTVRPSEQAA